MSVACKVIEDSLASYQSRLFGHRCRQLLPKELILLQPGLPPYDGRTSWLHSPESPTGPSTILDQALNPQSEAADLAGSGPLTPVRAHGLRHGPRADHHEATNILWRSHHRDLAFRVKFFAFSALKVRW